MKSALQRRLFGTAALGVGGAFVASLVAMLVHADAQRAKATAPHEERQRASVVRLVGVADLAVSSSSRWLRHPSVSEPGAAFSDAPAMLDTDPAGAAVAPPRALYHGMERANVRVRRGARRGGP